MTLPDRFWTKVNKTTSCWFWLANKNVKGYGRFMLNKKARFAHRLAFQEANLTTDITKLLILHHCDTPSCVNPSHLYAGTPSNNMLDMWSRGRHPLPKPNAKLKESDVRAIRAASGSTIELGKQYGVSSGTISMIRNKLTWRHLA